MTNYTSDSAQNNGVASAPNSAPASVQPFASAANGVHPLTLTIDGQREQIPAAALLDQGFAAGLRSRIQASNQPVEVDIRHLLDWPHDVASKVLAFVISCGSRCRVRSSDDGQAGELFAVVVGLIPDASDIDRCKRAISLAVYTAAMTHGDGAPLAGSRIAARLKELGVTGYTAAKLTKQIQQQADALRRVQVAAANAPALVCNILHDAPGAEDAVLPAGWELDGAGVRRAGADAVGETIPAAIIISQRLRNVATGAEFVELAWNRGQGWRGRVVPRGLIATARTITSLAEFGAPITSNNAALAVQYLADYETSNLDALGATEVTEQLGWHGEGSPDRFLLGDRVIAITGGDASEPALRFHGGDDGDEQQIRGYRAGGEFAAWQTAVAPVGHLPQITLVCYVALSAALLRLLDAANFVFGLAGPTSLGKTNALRIAASVWGNPDEGDPAAAMATWDSTRVYIERAMSVRCDLPLIVDDTKRAKRSQDVAQTIYDATSGRGRGRGTPTGTRQTQTWNTVLMMSGESSATAFTEDGGTRARVLELWGSPFGSVSGETAALINTVNVGIFRHHGHAGPRFIEHLLAIRDQWGDLRLQYGQLRAEYQAMAGDNNVALRMADHFAVIALTATLAHEARIFPWPYRDVVSELWGTLTSGSHEADRAAVALRYVMSWAHAHRAEFSKHCRMAAQEPHCGWAGRWGDRDDFVGFLPHKLDELLRAREYEPQAIRRMWQDRGWLRITDGKNTYRARMLHQGDPVSLVAITQAAITEVLGSDDEAEEESQPVTFGLRPTRTAATA